MYVLKLCSQYSTYLDIYLKFSSQKLFVFHQVELSSHNMSTNLTFLQTMLLYHVKKWAFNIKIEYSTIRQEWFRRLKKYSKGKSKN